MLASVIQGIPKRCAESSDQSSVSSSVSCGSEEAGDVNREMQSSGSGLVSRFKEISVSVRGVRRRSVDSAPSSDRSVASERSGTLEISSETSSRRSSRSMRSRKIYSAPPSPLATATGMCRGFEWPDIPLSSFNPPSKAPAIVKLRKRFENLQACLEGPDGCVTPELFGDFKLTMTEMQFAIRTELWRQLGEGSSKQAVVDLTKLSCSGTSRLQKAFLDLYLPLKADSDLEEVRNLCKLMQVKVNMNNNQLCQSTDNALELFMNAKACSPSFSRICERIKTAVDVPVKMLPFKSFERMAVACALKKHNFAGVVDTTVDYFGEKSDSERYEEQLCPLKVNFDFSAICDVLRGRAKCACMDDVKNILRILLAEEQAGTLKIVGVDDRFSWPCQRFGWVDLKVYFYLGEDESRHICEFQITHKDYMQARKELGGHDFYSTVRAAVGLVELGIRATPYWRTIHLCTFRHCVEDAKLEIREGESWEGWDYNQGEQECMGWQGVVFDDAGQADTWLTAIGKLQQPDYRALALMQLSGYPRNILSSGFGNVRDSVVLSPCCERLVRLLARSPRGMNVKDLALGRCTGIVQTVKSAITSFRRLARLDISRCSGELTENEVAKIATYASNSRLRTLVLGDIIPISKFKDGRTTQIDLSNRVYSPIDCVAIAHLLLHHKQIRSLTMQNGNIPVGKFLHQKVIKADLRSEAYETPELLIISSLIASGQNISSLNLARSNFDIMSLQALARAIRKNPMLETVTLHDDVKIPVVTVREETHVSLVNSANSKRVFTEEDAILMGFVMSHNTNLVHFEMSGHVPGDAGVAAIAKSLKYLQLQSLILENCRVSQIFENVDSLQQVPEWVPNPHCKCIAALSEALKTNESLTALSLKNNHLSDESFRLLADALKANSTLKHLNLERTGLGMYHDREFDVWAADDNSMALTYLASGIKFNSGLETLNLRKNMFSKRGALDLANALSINSTLLTVLAGDTNCQKGAASVLKRYRKRIKGISFWF